MLETLTIIQSILLNCIVCVKSQFFSNGHRNVINFFKYTDKIKYIKRDESQTSNMS